MALFRRSVASSLLANQVRSTQRRAAFRHFRPRAELLEDRRLLATGIFNENFSDELDLSRPGFDQFDNFPARDVNPSDPGDTTYDDPATINTLAPDELLIVNDLPRYGPTTPVEINGQLIYLRNTVHEGPTSHGSYYAIQLWNPALNPFETLPNGHYLSVFSEQSFGHMVRFSFPSGTSVSFPSGTPGGLAPGEEVSLVAFSYWGAARYEIEGTNGTLTHSFVTNLWQRAVIGRDHRLPGGQELGAIRSVRFISESFDGDSRLALDDLTVLVGETEVNHPQVGEADTYTFAHGATGAYSVTPALGVLANDHDPDGGPLTAALAGQAEFGNVTMNSDGSFTYTPTTPGNRLFNDDFTYTVSHGPFTSFPIQVRLRARDNQVPTATGGAVAFDHGAPGPLQFFFPVSDANGDPLIAEIIDEPVVADEPQHGSVSVQVVGGRVEFAYQTGLGRVINSDRFSYRVFDGYDWSAPATVDIRVPNRAPVAHPDIFWPDANIDEIGMQVVDGNPPYLLGNVLEGIDVWSYFALPPEVLATIDQGRDQDADGDALQVAAIVAEPRFGRLLEWLPSGQFKYELPTNWRDHPAPSEPRFDTFRYRVSDGVQSSEATVVIDRYQASLVVAYPLKYQVSAGESLFVPREIGLISVEGVQYGWDFTIDPFPSHGSFRDGDLLIDGSFHYDPQPRFVGADSFQINVTPFNMPRPVTIEVTSRAPIALADAYETFYDLPLDITEALGLLRNDTEPDRGPLWIDRIGDPQHGTIQSWTPGGAFHYRPNPGFSGTDTFVYRATDEHGAVAEGTVTITVRPNRPPQVSPELELDVENQTNLPLPPPAIGELVWSDFEGDAVTAAVAPGHGPRYGRAAVRVVGNRVRVEYYADQGQFAPLDEFRVTVSDSQGTSAPALVRVVREGTNHLPVAQDDFFVIQYQPLGATDVAPVLVAFPGVTWNDQDADGDVLSATLVSGPTRGVATLESDGSFSYRPLPGLFGQDTFTYEVQDADGIGSSQGTVTLRVVDPQAEQVPTAHDDQHTQAWAAGDVPGNLEMALLEALEYGQVVVDNDTRPPDWGGTGSADWALRLIARPRQIPGTGHLVVPEGLVSLDDLGLAKFRPVIPGQGLSFLVGVVEATYAYQDLRHHGYLSNFARVRFVVTPPAEGTHTNFDVNSPIDLNVQASPGVLLQALRLDPLPAPLPPGFFLPYGGVINLVLGGVAPGGTATVTLRGAEPFPADLVYLKYGRRDDDPVTAADESQPQWYEFGYDAVTGTGAQIVGDTITLHFVDGLRGDDDRLANGVISDPGAPALARVAPRVESIVINDGQAQRSVVNSLSVAFSDLVTIGKNAFELKKVGARKAIDLKVVTSSVAGHTVARLTFKNGRDVTAGSLRDGTYRLTIRADKVKDADGKLLDGDGDGVAGGNYVDDFFRRFGDTDGDGDVDLLDKQVFDSAYGKRRGNAGYLWYLDSNANGKVWKDDLAQFLLGYNRRFKLR